jgi:hypothetical protein
MTNIEKIDPSVFNGSCVSLRKVELSTTLPPETFEALLKYSPNLEILLGEGRATPQYLKLIGANCRSILLLNTL